MSHVTITNDCWLWTGSINENGYGLFKVSGKTMKSHRVAYETYNRPIETGNVIDHLCKVRNCVKPDHLEQVSQAENLYRGNTIASVNRLKKYCINGHEFTEDNTIIRKNNTRNCRKCINLLKKKYRARR